MTNSKRVLSAVFCLLALFCFCCGEMSLNTLYTRDYEFRGITFALCLFLLIFFLWRLLKCQTNAWTDRICIFLFALSLRLAVGLSYTSLPVSDFLTEYQTASALAAGDRSLVMSVKYTHNFPFILPFVFYQTLLIRIFSNSLRFLQGINALITASICLVL